MLTIPPELALAFDTATLARWKVEIAAQIARDHPQTMTPEALQDWVRAAMETVRRAGATSRADMDLYARALFQVTEAATDTNAVTDFVAIMTANLPYAKRIATLRKAFPL